MTDELSDEDGLAEFEYTWERGRDENNNGILETSEWSQIDPLYTQSSGDLRISSGDVDILARSGEPQTFNGKFAVVWNENNADGDGLGVFASVVDSTGTILVDKFQVSDNAIYDQNIKC